jgi:predicted RNase H-related nuclease YkuK (DUF458 family)
MNEERKFENYKGEIQDVVSYILDWIKLNPGNEEKGISSPYKISLGCDSNDRSRKTSYSIAIVFYDESKRDGAHVVHKNISIPKSLIRKGMMISQWKQEKVHIEREDKILSGDDGFIFNRLFIENQYLLELGLYLDEQLKGKYWRKHDPNKYDGSKPYRLPEIHVDYNAKEMDDQHHLNKSNRLYQMGMGMFCSYGFKVFGKPESWASSSAADAYCRTF